MNTRGELKFSLDGTRIAMAGNGAGNEPNTDMLAVFDFDPGSGMVSNALVLPPLRGDFAMSFSPDGTKLYGATWKAFNFTAAYSNFLYQYDLSSGDPTTISNSLTVLWSNPVTQPFGSLQLGPDGRVYVARNGSGYLGVINDPDQPGMACGYEHDGIYLAGKTGSFGLNNFIQYIDCAPTTSVAVNSSPSDDLLIQVDPASSSITLGGALATGGSVSSLRIADAAGRLVLGARMNGSTCAVPQLQAGVYVAAALNARGEMLATRSFIWCP